MDILWHINLNEMLGDMTVATFLILLAASVVVVGSMISFPLIDLALGEKKIESAIRQHDGLTAEDASWRAGPAWLMLRSNFLRQLSELPLRRGRLTLVQGSGQFPEPHHWTSLIKRTKTTAQKNTDLIVPYKKRPDSKSASSNAA